MEVATDVSRYFLASSLSHLLEMRGEEEEEEEGMGELRSGLLPRRRGRR
jgi:hypothetical protein